MEAQNLMDSVTGYLRQRLDELHHSAARADIRREDFTSILEDLCTVTKIVSIASLESTSFDCEGTSSFRGVTESTADIITAPICGADAEFSSNDMATIYDVPEISSSRPPYLYCRDQRRQLVNSEKIFYCDLCDKPFHYQGVLRPYEGNFINKTWNTDEDKQDPNFTPVTREQLYYGWRGGIYDLTWHCLKRHASLIGRPNDLKGVAQIMRLWRQADERKRRKEERRRKCFWKP